MSIRDRILEALSCRQPDRVPCCFMIFAALRNQCASEEQFVQRQLELGLDAFVHLGHLPISFDASVTTALSKQPDPQGDGWLLSKTYNTPAGKLTTIVRQTADWPHGDDVPLFDDYLIPRCIKFPVATRADLPALRYLFGPFRDDDIAAYRRRARQLAALAQRHDLPTAAGWGRGGDPGVMGMDAAMWLVGMENMILLAHEQPDTVAELAEIIAQWNRRQIQIMLDPQPDLLIRRGWYETTEFWTPAQYRRFIQPQLEAEAELAHQAGAKYGYIITSAMMPLVEDILAAGVDVIIGVDPLQGKGTDLQALKQATIGRAALWGGVNGFLTVELASPQETAEAVRQAIESLAPGGGFILSPVDNVRRDEPRVWDNVRALIAACRTYGRYDRTVGLVEPPMVPPGSAANRQP